MSNFLREYLNKLRKSDEKTRHRSALTISVILSVIVLAITFLLIKDSYLSLPNKTVTTKMKETAKVESPLTSFAKFFKEAGKQVTNFKAIFVESQEKIPSSKTTAGRELEKRETSVTYATTSTTTSETNSGGETILENGSSSEENLYETQN